MGDGKPATKDTGANPRRSGGGTEEATDSTTQLKEDRRRGGGKLGRTETVTVRLDPKLRYLAGLAARKHRRTLSSFIEWALEQQTNQVCLDDEQATFIKDEAACLWDVDDADRFAKLAIRHPTLLSHEEQIRWKLIRENGYLWRGFYRIKEGNLAQKLVWTWKISEESLIAERLRKHWDEFCKAADPEGGETDLPEWPMEGEPTVNSADEIPLLERKIK